MKNAAWQKESHGVYADVLAHRSIEFLVSSCHGSGHRLHFCIRTSLTLCIKTSLTLLSKNTTEHESLINIICIT